MCIKTASNCLNCFEVIGTEFNNRSYLRNNVGYLFIVGKSKDFAFFSGFRNEFKKMYAVISFSCDLEYGFDFVENVWCYRQYYSVPCIAVLQIFVFCLYTLVRIVSQATSHTTEIESFVHVRCL